jgi:hypothetical protein
MLLSLPCWLTTRSILIEILNVVIRRSLAEDIMDKYLASCESCLSQTPVEELSRLSKEWDSHLVFFLSRGFAYEAKLSR